MADFFISYSSADRAWAEWIALELKKAGYDVIIQTQFPPGASFLLEMKKAAQESKYNDCGAFSQLLNVEVLPVGMGRGFQPGYANTASSTSISLVRAMDLSSTLSWQV